MSEEQRLEKERLMEWMVGRGFDTASLADATGDTFSTVHMITKGNRPVSDAFKWRFGVAFGFDEAKSLFLSQPVLQPA